MSNKNWILVISLGILWGSSFLYIEILLNHINAWMIVFLRVSLASLFLIFLCLYKKIKWRSSLKDYFNVLVMSLINNVIPFMLIVMGQESITGGLASIINSSTSFFSIILASLFISREKLTLNRVLGVIIGVLGVTIAIGYENLMESSNKDIGIYLILIATVSYALAGVWAKTRMQNIPSMISATGMTSFSALFLLPFIFLYHREQFDLIDHHVFFHALMFALFCSVFAYLLYFKILETTGAGNLLICTIIIPPSSIILNTFFMEEMIMKKEIIGLMIVTMGLIVLDGRILKKSL